MFSWQADVTDGLAGSLDRHCDSANQPFSRVWREILDSQVSTANEMLIERR